MLQGPDRDSAARPEAAHDSEGAEGATGAAAVLLTVCWKALGESSTEIPDPGTARPAFMGTA